MKKIKNKKWLNKVRHEVMREAPCIVSWRAGNRKAESTSRSVTVSTPTRGFRPPPPLLVVGPFIAESGRKTPCQVQTLHVTARYIHVTARLHERAR